MSDDLKWMFPSTGVDTKWTPRTKQRAVEGVITGSNTGFGPVAHRYPQRSKRIGEGSWLEGVTLNI